MASNPRKDIYVTLLGGRFATINGNDMGNDHTKTMIEEWLASGAKELTVRAIGLTKDQTIVFVRK